MTLPIGRSRSQLFTFFSGFIAAFIASQIAIFVVAFSFLSCPNLIRLGRPLVCVVKSQFESYRATMSGCGFLVIDASSIDPPVPPPEVKLSSVSNENKKSKDKMKDMLTKVLKKKQKNWSDEQYFLNPGCARSIVQGCRSETSKQVGIDLPYNLIMDDNMVVMDSFEHREIGVHDLMIG